MASPSTYWLRHLNQDRRLPIGRFTLGRSSACDLSLDDPLVSRQHAAIQVHENRVLIEDLESRNGILVNGAPVRGKVALGHADRITIGRHDLFLLEDGRLKRDQKITQAEPMKRVEIVPPHETQNEMLVDTLLRAWERALSEGNLEEAESAGDNLLSALHEMIEQGDAPERDSLETAARVGIELCERTGEPHWLDRVFEAFTQAERLLPGSWGDRLLQAAHKVGYRGSPQLDEYLMKISEITLETPDRDRALMSNLARLSSP